MNSARHLAACTLLAMATSAAYCTEKPDTFSAQKAVLLKTGTDPVTRYLQSVALGHMMCSMSINKARDNAAYKKASKDDIAFANYRQCIDEHSASFKTNYTLATKATANNQALSKELKEHYILAVDQLQGIVPGDDERVIDYERRTEAQKRATAKQLIRVKAELP